MVGDKWPRGWIACLYGKHLKVFGRTARAGKQTLWPPSKALHERRCRYAGRVLRKRLEISEKDEKGMK
jgi:hypothetical protein